MKRFIVICATLSVAVFSLLLNSCIKDGDNNKDPNIVRSEIYNPFDFVGEVHNEGLDAVLGSLSDTKSLDVTENEIGRMVNEFCDKVFAEDERFFQDLKTRSDVCDADVVVDSSEVVLSDAALKYYEQIVAVANTNDYSYIKDQFRSFEEDIISYRFSDFSEYEKTFLLCSIAVGKYSNEYWNEKLMNTRGLGASIVVGDLIGACKGISKNAIIIVVSSVGGPVSVISTAARSALGPAIAGSVEAALLYGAAQL